jgi:tetratricopeptide (TPR) repeat protein
LERAGGEETIIAHRAQNKITMGINTYEVMYIQARDNYPYNVDECIEKLQYVIAADEEHAGAHCLMGQIYEEQLEDFNQAEFYYRMTLYLNKDYVSVYRLYAHMLIKLNRFEEALKIIDLAFKVPGIDGANMLYLKGLMYEKYEMYASAVDCYTEAKKASLTTYYLEAMDSHIKRVKDKKAMEKKIRKKSNVKGVKKEKTS